MAGEVAGRLARLLQAGEEVGDGDVAEYGSACVAAAREVGGWLDGWSLTDRSPPPPPVTASLRLLRMAAACDALTRVLASDDVRLLPLLSRLVYTGSIAAAPSIEVLSVGGDGASLPSPLAGAAAVGWAEAVAGAWCAVANYSGLDKPGRRAADAVTGEPAPMEVDAALLAHFSIPRGAVRVDSSDGATAALRAAEGLFDALAVPACDATATEPRVVEQGVRATAAALHMLYNCVCRAAPAPTTALAARHAANLAAILATPGLWPTISRLAAAADKPATAAVTEWVHRLGTVVLRAGGVAAALAPYGGNIDTWITSATPLSTLHLLEAVSTAVTPGDALGDSGGASSDAASLTSRDAAALVAGVLASNADISTPPDSRVPEATPAAGDAAAAAAATAVTAAATCRALRAIANLLADACVATLPADLAVHAPAWPLLLHRLGWAAAQPAARGCGLVPATLRLVALSAGVLPVIPTAWAAAAPDAAPSEAAAAEPTAAAAAVSAAAAAVAPTAVAAAPPGLRAPPILVFVGSRTVLDPAEPTAAEWATLAVRACASDAAAVPYLRVLAAAAPTRGEREGEFRSTRAAAAAMRRP